MLLFLAFFAHLGSLFWGTLGAVAVVQFLVPTLIAFAVSARRSRSNSRTGCNLQGPSQKHNQSTLNRRRDNY
eukprot:4861497-Amphidinium_carterae.1